MNKNNWRSTMMSTRFVRIFSALMVVAVFLSACTGSTSTDNEKQPLRVAWSLYPGYYPVVIGVEKGIFEKHGVKVEPVYYAAYSNQLPDLSAGMIDGAAMLLSDTLFDSLSRDVKAVLVVDNSDGADHIVASSTITDLKDLKGKRIGVQANTISGVLLVRRMLEANGVSPADVTFVQIGPEDVPASIPNVIDIGYTFEPFTSQSRAKGDKIIFTSANTPGLVVDVIAFRREIIQNRPEDMKAFVDAWFETLKYWQDNPAEGNAIMAKATGQKPEDISLEGVSMFDLNANLKAFTEGTDTTSVYFTAQNQLNFIVSTGDITEPVDVKDLLDPSFLK